MRHVERSALMPYSAEQMFNVVNDVASYPKFLPWCIASEVLESTSRVMVARLELAKGGMRQSFTTRNDLEPPKHMKMSLVDGPFSLLKGEWHFKQLGEDGCKIEMSLSFDFNNRLMNVTLGKVFGVAADKMVDAFCERADVLYGG
ncbi:MAG: type II toxin-antitoxin system RatA family toxin [Pseudomonadales bacterium]|jgi:ribosome-associated toxin RatA of RatAB toxin-antitoxin module